MVGHYQPMPGEVAAVVVIPTGTTFFALLKNGKLLLASHPSGEPVPTDVAATPHNIKLQLAALSTLAAEKQAVLQASDLAVWTRLVCVQPAKISHHFFVPIQYLMPALLECWLRSIIMQSERLAEINVAMSLMRSLTQAEGAFSCRIEPSSHQMADDGSLSGICVVDCTLVSNLDLVSKLL